MTDDTENDYSDFSMLELFRMEVESQLEVLNKGLLDLEHTKPNSKLIEPLMRAAHSIKGAARMVNVDAVVRLSHVIEECFVSVGDSEKQFSRNDIDSLLSGIDLILQISIVNDEGIIRWGAEHLDEMLAMEERLKLVYSQIKKRDSSLSTNNLELALEEVESASIKYEEDNAANLESIDQAAVAIRIPVERLDKIYGLVGKSLVESHQLNVLIPEFWQVKHKYQAIISQLNHLQENLVQIPDGILIKDQVKKIIGSANELRHEYGSTISKLDAIDRRASSITDLLHREIMSSRMRPISEILNGLPRMVRDLGRSLNKDVRIQISGLSTLVDRHVLEKIDASIKHIVQNAIDHGIELPEERVKQEKLSLATIKLDVVIKSGMLQIVIEDDGKGVDIDVIKEVAIAKNMATVSDIDRLDENEILDFLFFPGFSTREEVSNISGRGVGLDLVKDAVSNIGGSVQLSSRKNEGSRFKLILPLTVSVLRVFLVTIGGESYSFPVKLVEQLIYFERKKIKTREHGSFVYFNGIDIQLIHSNSIYGHSLPEDVPTHIAVIILGDKKNKFAVVIERTDGEQEVSIQKLSSDFGRIHTINSAAILNNGFLTLVIDIEEYLQAIKNLLEKNRNQKISREDFPAICKVIKVLVVDDSITVRETERQLLTKLHYKVSVADDGYDALDKLENGDFDILVTDIDMPNMDGIRLINELRFRAVFSDLPILIVSNREKFFIEESVVLDNKTRFYEKDTFTPTGFVEAIQQLEQLVDIVSAE